MPRAAGTGSGSVAENSGSGWRPRCRRRRTSRVEWIVRATWQSSVTLRRALLILQDDRVAVCRDPRGDEPGGNDSRDAFRSGRPAREWYVRARDAAAGWPPSDARAGDVAAGRWQGIGYAERGSWGMCGRRRRHTASCWRWLPRAETHFLLAQFYEDAQQAESGPRTCPAGDGGWMCDRYGQAGRRLIDKLVTFHFGCLGCFRAEGGEVGPGGGRF